MESKVKVPRYPRSTNDLGRDRSSGVAEADNAQSLLTGCATVGSGSLVQM